MECNVVTSKGGKSGIGMKSSCERVDHPPPQKGVWSCPWVRPSSKVRSDCCYYCYDWCLCTKYHNIFPSSNLVSSYVAISILYLPRKIRREEKQDNILETSNGRKIASTAPISMIFGSTESRSCQLNLQNKSHDQKTFHEGGNIEKLLEMIEKVVLVFRFWRKTK